MKSELSLQSTISQPLYQSLQKNKVQLRNHAKDRNYEFCLASICKQRQKRWLGFKNTQILFCLIEYPDRQYKIGYKNYVSNGIQNNPIEAPNTHELDSADVSCIKTIDKNKDSLLITFKAKKQQWNIKFSSISLCDEWYSFISQIKLNNQDTKIYKSDNFKISKQEVGRNQNLKYNSCLYPNPQQSAFKIEHTLQSLFQDQISFVATMDQINEKDSLKAQLKKVYQSHLDQYDFISYFTNRYIEAQSKWMQLIDQQFSKRSFLVERKINSSILNKGQQLTGNKGNSSIRIKSLSIIRKQTIQLIGRQTIQQLQNKMAYQLQTNGVEKWKSQKQSQRESADIYRKVIIQRLPIKNKFTQDRTDNKSCLNSVFQLLQEEQIYKNIQSQILPPQQYLLPNERANQKSQTTDQTNRVSYETQISISQLLQISNLSENIQRL